MFNKIYFMSAVLLIIALYTTFVWHIASNHTEARYTKNTIKQMAININNQQDMLNFMNPLENMINNYNKNINNNFESQQKIVNLTIINDDFIQLINKEWGIDNVRF